MSFDLGGIAGEVISGIGGLADELATALTGDKTIGDAVGLAVDLATGNYLGAVSEGADLIEAGMGHQGAGETRTLGTGGGAEGCPPPGMAAAQAQVAADSAAAQAGTQATQGYAAHPAARAASAQRAHAASPAEASTAQKIREILADPTLSLEDRVSMLLSTLVDGLDQRIDDKASALAASQDPSSSKSGNDTQLLQTQLQSLMQKRSQMIALESNLMGMFQQTAMQVIQNIR